MIKVKEYKHSYQVTVSKKIGICDFVYLQKKIIYLIARLKKKAIENDLERYIKVGRRK